MPGQNYLAKIFLSFLLASAIFLFCPEKVLAENLLSNPGFEDGTSSWSKNGGVLEQASTPVHGGNYSASLTSTTISTKWIYQIISVTGGTSYVFSGYILKNEENVSSACLRIAWYASSDGSGSELNHVDSTEILEDNGPDFRYLTTDIVMVPDDANSARIKGVSAFNSTAEATVYFDDFSFEETTLSPITPTPTNAPATGTYKINEVKDENSNVLSGVEIYVDGEYVHHYAPEALTFCNGCKCDTYVECGFGEHTIRLGKSGYENWEKTITVDPGFYDEDDPVMTLSQLSTPTSTPEVPTPTPTKKPTPSPTPIPTPTGEILSEATPLAEEASPSSEVLGETSRSPLNLLPKILIGTGILLLLISGAFLLLPKIRGYNKGEDEEIPKIG